MKMSDGGYRPAFNVQFATTTGTRVIVGVAVTNAGSDFGQLPPMLTQLQDRYRQVPPRVLVDGSYAKKQDLVTVSAPPWCTTVYAPVQLPKAPARDRYTPRPDDPPAVAAWRQRMGTVAAQTRYQARAATAEWANAQARNRGFRQVLVRGAVKVRAIALLQALAINLLQSLALQPILQAAPA